MAAPEKSGAAKAPKYEPAIVEAARRANELRSHQAKRIGPKQAERVLAALRERAEGELTSAEAVRLSGLKSVKALKDAAAGRGTREDVAALRPFTSSIKDQYVQGQWGAALLAAWAEVLKEAKS